MQIAIAHARYHVTCTSIVTDFLSPAIFEILGPKHIGVTTLTFQGQVTSSITWRFDSQYRISYWCFIGTKSLSPSVFEIFGFKYIGVTTLTFQCHVTSSITWRIDFPYRISYWCSIGTKSLSPSVFKIFGAKMPVQCKSSLRMRDITWPVNPMQNLGTYLNFPPPHCLFTMTLLLGSDED